jgi:pimeloyl-ACP methyl ester carboxylesterase
LFLSEKATIRSGEVDLAVSSNGSTDRPTLAFIHGYPDTKEEWDPVRARLSDEFHTVAYDVRGAGESTVPERLAAYDLDRLADDLVAVLDALAPGKRVHLVGHDWGGLQGWEFATSTRLQGRLASFTAIAGPSLDQVTAAGRDLLRSGRVLEWLRRARYSWYILFLVLPGVPRLLLRRGPTPEQWRQRLGIPEDIARDLDYPRPTLRSDAIHGANLYRRNIPRRLWRPRVDATAHVPVSLIIPTRDPYIPSDYYEYANQHAPSMQRREIDAGHWVQLTQPDAVADLIRSFVAEVEGRIEAG